MGRPAPYALPLSVRYHEVDALGVVFNMWYLGWCDEAMTGYLAHRGLPYDQLRGSGFDTVLRHADVDWTGSLGLFEQAEVRVSTGAVGTTSFRLDYEVVRCPSYDVCFRAAITYVCVAIDGTAVAPTRVAVPAALREALGEASSGAPG